MKNQLGGTLEGGEVLRSALFASLLPPPSSQADLARDSTRQKEVNTYQHSATKHEGRVAKLTQDLKTKQTETTSKGRRHGRSLATVQSQLEGNRTNQRLSRMAQAEVEAELKGREMMERMEVGMREWEWVRV